MIALNSTPHYDCILVGGGLQSGLIALALNHFHPQARVLMIERGSELAGNHTWSFHPGDVPADCLPWIAPLVEYRWSNYEVRLKNFHRRVQLEYASTSSAHFADCVAKLFAGGAAPPPSVLQRVVELAVAGRQEYQEGPVPSQTSSTRAADAQDPPWQLLTNTEVLEIDEEQVVTRSGQSMYSDLIVDCRGPTGKDTYAGCGYQKFFGFEMELGDDWPDENPVVMESVEDQRDGFRFLYTLPFDRRRVMVEDTRFSDVPNLDRDECWRVVAQHVRRRGIADFRIVREESGVLPMPFTGERMPAAHTPLAGGYAGGWFHAATGYSFPMAVAFAQAVASGPLSGAASRVEQLSQEQLWRANYSRLLNRLLFRLVTPRDRYRIFKRFYRILGDEAVERFYSHQFRLVDAFRIVCGLPPTLLGLQPVRFLRSFLSRNRQ